jgi:hypothetical protein
VSLPAAFHCRDCGLACKSEAGVARHKRSCKAAPPPLKRPGPAAPLPRVRCMTCAETFATAQQLGQHRTLKHFGEISLTRCTLTT